MDSFWKLIGLLIVIFLVSGCGGGTITSGSVIDSDYSSSSIKTFSKVDNDICEEGGKPIIRLFSTTRCPHCVWIKDTFDKVALEYVKEDKIVAYHWELDVRDNTLTLENG